MNKKILAAVCLVAVLQGATLAACSNSAPTKTVSSTKIASDGNGWTQLDVKLVNGWIVTCLIWADGRKGGPTCDWDHKMQAGQ